LFRGEGDPWLGKHASKEFKGNDSLSTAWRPRSEGGWQLADVPGGACQKGTALKEYERKNRPQLTFLRANRGERKVTVP